MIFNYGIGNSLNGNFKKVQVSRKILLTFGVCANLSVLGYFKYADFLISNVNELFGVSFGSLNLLLPLAISFFTFQQIAYLVDSYRKETAEYSFLNYSLFVTFFPQLIAGPIVHHAEMMSQFSSRFNLVKNHKNIAAGLFIFSLGLFKKVVIADSFAAFATAGFDSSEDLAFFEAWTASLSYTFQLYFDFSGYTDMAIGAALLFNIKLPVNFNSPYKASNIQDFWRRWHMTLSRFLRNYVYLPLGGNRNGSFNTISNLMFTFVLGGIWHGAGWTFIVWGGLHGLAISVHRLWQQLGIRLYKPLAWFLTFNFVNVAWVFFRANDWDDAIRVVGGMTDFSSISTEGFSVLKIFGEMQSSIISSNYNFFVLVEIFRDQNYAFIWIFLALILIFCRNSNQLIDRFSTNALTLVFGFICFVFSSIWISMGAYSEFLYFNF
jgi:D-alanyl-lipoteichoic acid acyltransferase DltB (MBOAT superfamily)